MARRILLDEGPTGEKPVQRVAPKPAPPAASAPEPPWGTIRANAITADKLATPARPSWASPPLGGVATGQPHPPLIHVRHDSGLKAIRVLIDCGDKMAAVTVRWTDLAECANHLQTRTRVLQRCRTWLEEAEWAEGEIAEALHVLRARLAQEYPG